MPGSIVESSPHVSRYESPSALLGQPIHVLDFPTRLWTTQSIQVVTSSCKLWGNTRIGSMSWAFLNCFPAIYLFILGQTFSFSLQLFDSFRPAIHWVSGILLPPPQGLQEQVAAPSFAGGCCNLNSCPHTYAASSLPTEPSIQPLSNFCMTPFCLSMNNNKYLMN